MGIYDPCWSPAFGRKFRLKPGLQRMTTILSHYTRFGASERLSRTDLLEFLPSSVPMKSLRQIRLPCRPVPWRQEHDWARTGCSCRPTHSETATKSRISTISASLSTPGKLTFTTWACDRWTSPLTWCSTSANALRNDRLALAAQLPPVFVLGESQLGCFAQAND